MDKITLRKLKMLVESEHWDAIHIFVDKVVGKWNSVPVKADTEFETMWNVATREAKVEGVREFINSIEELTNETNV